MKTRLPLAAVLALVTAVSCFSERNGVTDPGGADCTIPANAFGRNRIPVIIRNFTFFSDTVRIRAGGTVTWVNCEDANVAPHTSTANGGVWDSGDLQPGDVFEHTFTTAGTFRYFCRPHTFMTGVVIVE